jgi:carboxylate-amine ligase
MDHAYGRGPVFTVGIEEELLLVDPQTHSLAPVAADVLRRLDAPPNAAGPEAYAAEIELRSPPCRSAGEAVDRLRTLRAAARRAGATLLAVGVHPEGELFHADLMTAERYRAVEASMRGLIRRTPECALHVHIGMPDPETAIRACNGLRRRLPLLVGLAASSPWWFGRDSGLASARYALVRAYPRRGVPRAFRDWEDYVATATAVVQAGDLADESFLWWDVRPHPGQGTVEVREMDVQAPLGHTAALAALVHGLALHSATVPAASPDPPAEVLDESCFRAARDGVDAVILDGDALRPLPEIAREAVAMARSHLRPEGADAALDGVEAILRGGGGAARQRAAHQRGGLQAVLEQLLEESAAD